MRILLSTFGSRGDVEPLAALGAALRSLGAEAVVCAPSDAEFAALLDRAGVPLAPAFTAVRTWAADAMANRPPMPLPERAAQVMAAQYEALSAAAEGCDAILATGLFPSVAAARCVAEVRGLPYVHAAYCPVFIPSEHHRPHDWPTHPLPDDETDIGRLWDRDIQTMNSLFGGAMAGLRARIGLPPVDNVRDHVFTLHPLLAADPVIAPWPATTMRDVVQTGAWILPDDRPLPADLLAFLEAGEAPVYLGFGSMPMEALKTAGRAAVDAVRAQGRRVLLSRGWADLALTDGAADGFAIGDVNQQALFPRVAAVIHHGGAGTTTAAARAGAPQVIVPQVADQPYFAGRVAALGIGVAHEGPTPTVDSLSAALEIALRPETRARAAAASATIRADGAQTAARWLLDRLTA
ncbi:MAG TPA: glycosyltransferase [Brevundimonas sp.]|nr:glycosyltransferase [Brevundimonas sp.]